MPTLRRASTRDRDVRVEDYLNDRLQTLSDLDGLDALLASVQEQQGLLKKQKLNDARVDLERTDVALREHTAHVHSQAQQFEKQQADIDRRLLVVTRSETTDDAVKRYEAAMAKLQQMDMATGYLELLREVERLRSDSAGQLQHSAQTALQPYSQLKKLHECLKPLHMAAEWAAPHLLHHVQQVTQDLFRRIRDGLSADLEKVMKKVDWPKPNAAVPSNLSQDWVDAITRLLDLQRPELESSLDSTEAGISMSEPVVLLPLQVLVQPLEMRFKYHYHGNRPTNRLDQPQLFFNYILEFVDTYNDFLTVHMQPILTAYFHGSDMALSSIYIEATSAFVTAVLPMLQAKASTTIEQVADRPQMLSHFVHELISFDSSLRERWQYDGGAGAGNWKGLASEILAKQGWFGRWLQVEKNFALQRYQEIIDKPGSGEIDYDSVDVTDTKPTKASIEVHDLLEAVTDLYKPLNSFSQKMSFLVEIQISIFDQFHERLQSSLEAYLSMTSEIGAKMQGISREERAKLQGTAGLDRLCRVYGSAEFLEKAMRDWSDDVFFLELWAELQERARPGAKRSVGGPLSVQDIAEKTSKAVGSDVGGALFDEIAGAYSRLRTRGEGIIVDVLTYNARQALKPYASINPWSSLSSDASSISAALVTPELDPVIQQLRTSLGFLSQCLGKIPLRRISRHVSLFVQTYLWDNVLTRQSFSTAGVSQFSTDITALCDALDTGFGRGQGQMGLRKLVEAVRLLGLPVRAKTEDGGGAGVPGLWEVEKRVFKDNESARAVLEEMGLEHVEVREARTVLERRIELSS